MSGGPFRVIEGGRTGEPTPGLLIVGAQEIATLEGGVRRGAEQGDIGRLVAEDLASHAQGGGVHRVGPGA